jgi:hypothetical protein
VAGAGQGRSGALLFVDAPRILWEVRLFGLARTHCSSHWRWSRAAPAVTFEHSLCTGTSSTECPYQRTQIATRMQMASRTTPSTRVRKSPPLISTGAPHSDTKSNSDHLCGAGGSVTYAPPCADPPARTYARTRALQCLMPCYVQPCTRCG